MVPDPNVTPTHIQKEHHRLFRKTRLFHTELMAGRISWYPGMATAMSMMQVEIRPYYEAFR